MSFALAHKSKRNKAEDSKTLTPAKHNISTHYPASDLNSDSSDHIFHPEQAIGNQTLQSLMHSNARGFDFSEIAIQPKLRVSQPEDEFEQEADRVADSVMRMPMQESPSLNEDDFAHKKSIGEEQVNRKCSACEMKEDEERKNLTISRKRSSHAHLEVSDEATNEINSARSGGGASLDADTKEFMQSRFGYDFCNIRIHTDGVAA